MSFTIEFDQKDEELLAKLKGDLDINTSPELKMAVLEEYRLDPKNIVFDLEKLDYLDSTGLGAFISIFKNIKEHDHTLKIVKAKDRIVKLFKITELDQIFEVEE